MLKHLVIGLAVSSLALAASGLQLASRKTTDAAPAVAAKPIVVAQYNPCPNLRCR